MSGRATDYNSTLDPSNPRILQYTAAGVLNTAAEPLGHPDRPANGGGPALAFARLYLESLPSDHKILLIPASYGGVAFSTPDSNGGNMSWDVTRPNTSNNMYERSLTQLANAIVAVNEEVVIDAALINVGGTDALNHVDGQTYTNNMTALINGYRTRLNLPNLPFVLGPSRPDAIAGNGWYAGINNAQMAIPSSISYTAYIPGATGNEFYKLSDTVHFNQVGHRVMAKRYLAAFQGAVNGVPTLSAPTGLSLNQPAQSTAIDIKWNEVEGAVGYKVEYKRSSSSTWSNFGTTAATNANHTGLTAGDYDFRVSAVDGKLNVGPVSPVFTVSH